SFVHDLDTDLTLESWPKPGGLILDGFRYERFNQCRGDVALRWLQLQPAFTASSYATLARAFDRLQLQRAATLIWVALKKQEISLLHPALRRWFNRVVFSLIGYGEQPWIALVIVAALFAGHAGTVEWAKRSGEMQPTISELVFQNCFYRPTKDCAQWKPVKIPESRDRFMPTDYPEFSTALYSLEAFLPPL